MDKRIRATPPGGVKVAHTTEELLARRYCTDNRLICPSQLLEYGRVVKTLPDSSGTVR